ncbi:MAG: hypothetical protein GY760_17755 [Deltaproteobacteria bacterium]|nr:hypothetical protein [Deltaproteobacteria bacterium]
MTVRTKLTAIISFCIVVMIVIGTIAITSFYSVKNQWADYLDSVQVKQAHLMNIRSQMGYGGAIHVFKNYVLRGQSKYHKRYMKKAGSILKDIEAYNSVGNLSSIEIKSLKKIEEMVEKYRAATQTAKELIDSGREVKEIDSVIKIDDNPYLKALTNLSSELNSQTKTRSKAFTDLVQTTNGFFMIAIPVTIIILLLLGFLLISSVATALNKAISLIHSSADQVAAGSSEVSASSQTLAEGTSEQAASIEETSSSMEEMSSMTKRNAENADQSNNLMVDANSIISSANDSMGKLIVSMEEISNASEETFKIIKTIDEIAFQTNLLALNAAVESASAGEAGAGFAVVADEVRTLAIRAADAAKNTTEMIKDTVGKINEGTKSVETANEAFVEIVESTGKVGLLVSEISTASGEQSEGIEQINRAIAEMDKVVQQNAASAEEAASTSEEMNAQAIQMKSAVNSLMTLVGGKIEHGYEPNESIEPKPEQYNPVRETTLHTFNDEVKPHQIIPFNDDFHDF